MVFRLGNKVLYEAKRFAILL